MAGAARDWIRAVACRGGRTVHHGVLCLPDTVVDDAACRKTFVSIYCLLSPIALPVNFLLRVMGLRILRRPCI